jgi:hypothetical protein
MKLLRSRKIFGQKGVNGQFEIYMLRNKVFVISRGHLAEVRQLYWRCCDEIRRVYRTRTTRKYECLHNYVGEHSDSLGNKYY